MPQLAAPVSRKEGLEMSDEKYPLLEIGEDEESMFFSFNVQEQACIGHLRGDFGRGDNFWTTWWDQHGDLKDQGFKDELDDVVNTLRENGPLKDLPAMQQFCREHSQAQMSPRSGTKYYGLRVDTVQHRYYLRFCPMQGNYNFYIFCYKTALLEKPIQVLVVEPTKPCEVREICGLKAMQELVGGCIQAVYPFRDDVALVCNRDAKNLGLPHNRPLTDNHGVPYDIICGTFFLADTDGEHFVSLTEKQIQRYKDLYDNNMIFTAERLESQAEIVSEAAMPDFAVACQLSFRFAYDGQEPTALRDVFTNHVNGIFNRDKNLSERTVGDLDFTFQGRCAEVCYTFARQDKDAASAEAFSEQCVRDVQGQLEEFGCKIEKIECFAEELEPDYVINQAKDRGAQVKKKKGVHHER